MVILQDTREQTPLVFDHPWITDIEVCKLDVGDYGVKFKDGHIPSIFFERKSIGDLFSTLGKGNRRYKREVKRAQDSNKTLVMIIEGNISKVLKGTKYSSLSGEQIIKTVMTFYIKHGVFPVFCKDAKDASKWITYFYISLGFEYIKRKKNGKR